MSDAALCCAATFEGPRWAWSAHTAELWRRAVGGPGRGGACAGWARGVDAIASTSAADTVAITAPPNGRLRAMAQGCTHLVYRVLLIILLVLNF